MTRTGRQGDPWKLTDNCSSTPLAVEEICLLLERLWPQVQAQVATAVVEPYNHVLSGTAGMEDSKLFVPFVLEASGYFGPDAAAFLDYLKTLCSFPILSFRRPREFYLR